METIELHAARWNLTQKIAFRFFLIFLSLFIFSGYIWDAVIPWAGGHILHVPYPITVKPNGSGDTTYNYVELFLNFCAAIIGTTIWSIVDYKRTSYNKLAYWHSVIMRYYLGYIMLNYGFGKVFQLQFPYPGPEMLSRTYGESSPMGLAWTFMGFSPAYNVFAGGLEVIGGILLFFRRTRVMGSILIIIVMTNVVMMNFCYDIPVKIFSCYYLLTALYLLYPDAKRLLHFFVLNKPVPKALNTRPVLNKRTNLVMDIIKSVLIVGMVWSNFYPCLQYKEESKTEKEDPLNGAFSVKKFSLNGKIIEDDNDQIHRWKRFTMDYSGRALIYLMDNSMSRYSIKLERKKHIIRLTSWDDSSKSCIFHYNQPNKDCILLGGNYNKDSCSAVLERIAEFPLIKRGFHWINEYPNSR